MASSRASSLPQVFQVGRKSEDPETTKPSHFCEDFVLYGAAPGVESIYNYTIYNGFICGYKVFYLLKYPLVLASSFTDANLYQLRSRHESL